MTLFTIQQIKSYWLAEASYLVAEAAKNESGSSVILKGLTLLKVLGELGVTYPYLRLNMPKELQYDLDKLHSNLYNSYCLNGPIVCNKRYTVSKAKHLSDIESVEAVKYTVINPVGFATDVQEAITEFFTKLEEDLNCTTTYFILAKFNVNPPFGLEATWK